MLGTYTATSRPLTWPAVRRRPRLAPLEGGNATARQAARHGARSAAQATCLAAAILAVAGAIGAARGPVVLSDPTQGTAQHVLVAPAGDPTGFRLGVAGMAATR
jgi:hypothetical protein